jgi:hypothetical protein
MAQVIKARRMHLQRKQAQWVADQQQATQEAQRVQALKSNTAAWEEVGRYRRFLEALESAAVRRTGGMLDSQSQVGRWLAWAKQYVDSADPVLRLVKLDGGSSGSK